MIYIIVSAQLLKLIFRIVSTAMTALSLLDMQPCLIDAITEDDKDLCFSILMAFDYLGNHVWGLLEMAMIIAVFAHKKCTVSL